VARAGLMRVRDVAVSVAKLDDPRF
jgi:hypothetical protein